MYIAKHTSFKDEMQKVMKRFMPKHVFSPPVKYWSADICETVTDTYLFTPWSRVLLEKLTGSAASQEIPRLFGTRRFITVLTSARHLSLS